ncbi:Septum formation initiator domain-containing protein [Fusarium acuminatum]|uniref:Septum formation initiator domain-containing protein n=1 Tax=Fusarium acuminatum TaxID=5515 RepID=A0ABZ2WX06_9HYPO
MASTGLTSPRDSVNSVSSVRSGSRHQLKRSITELASPVKLNRRKEKERDRYNEERASHAHHISVSHPLSPNSLYQGRASVDIMTRSEGVTPYMSPDQSRRPSLMLSREEETKAAITTSPTEPKTNEKAQEDQDKTSSQVEGLKQSLVELGTFSTSTARRLDETYYAVLQKMSTLQSTVSALKELAEESQSIHRNFEKDACEIENDITSQIAAMGQFKEHQDNIESLQTRVQDGRARIRALSDRVDIVREQVEHWERLDKKSQEKTRLRLRAIMVCITIVFLAVLVLFFGAQYVSRHGGFLGSDGSSTPRVAESIIESHKEAGHTALPLRRHEKGDSPYLKRKQAHAHTRRGEELRAFDEL